MKKLVIILMVVFASLGARAQDANSLVNALKSANADEVSNYFDKILDIKFPEKDEIKS